jgi:O-acetyl-ADP-ribose deacetylase (regulator of RNase III)
MFHYIIEVAMIELRTGNLLEADVEALVNTVNTVGVMGKGIALQFKRAFPEMEADYRRACQSGELKPGRMHVYVQRREDMLSSPRTIINFPTKRHWRHPSRLSDIAEGLQDLARVIRERGIRSIAVPPLGCGNGGLDWAIVLPMIKESLGNLEDVRVLVYEPNGAPPPSEQINRTRKPAMNSHRAALLGLLGRYRELGYDLTMIEIQKLAYFLQIAGQPLKLRFEKHHYGPYADDLRKVLRHLEGHFLEGSGDGLNSPETPIRLIPAGVAEAEEALAEGTETIDRFERVARLVEGYETPYGLELLSTVHWVATLERPPAKNPVEAMSLIQMWSPRKGDLMTREHVEIAWERLVETGYLITEIEGEDRHARAQRHLV